MLTQPTERKTMWQKSRNRKVKFGPALVLALVACSVTRGQDVRTNYMPGTDFSKYHTYAWVDELKGVPRNRWPARPNPGHAGQASGRFPNGGQGPNEGG
jgi:hypothetical protein